MLEGRKKKLCGITEEENNDQAVFEKYNLPKNVFPKKLNISTILNFEMYVSLFKSTYLYIQDFTVMIKGSNIAENSCHGWILTTSSLYNTDKQNQMSCQCHCMDTSLGYPTANSTFC